MFSATDFYKVAVESEETAGIIENAVVDGKEYLFVFRKLEGTESMVCALVPNEVMLMQVANIRYIAVIVVLIACVIAIILGGGISLSINNSIKYFIENIKKVAQGKIGTRFNVKKKDEFGYLVEHMNTMLDSVTKLLENAKEVSSEVSSSVEEVMNSSNTIYDSTNYISTAMDEIEIGLTQQANDTMVGVEMLERLADQMCIVEDGTTEIKNIADATQKSIGNSVEQMYDLKKRAGETTQITGQVITNVMKLNEKTKEIDTIINAINSIADETSLLALNASIEAARAGEAGKGFMVVADSIQQLAVQSVEATGRISDIVETIDGEIGAVVNIANKADGIIKVQETAVADTQASFDEMSNEVKILLDKLSDIIDSVAKMQRDKEVTVDKMQSISAVTEEVVASVSTVAGKAQQQVGIVDGLQGLSEKLSEQAVLLDASMKQFTIE